MVIISEKSKCSGCYSCFSICPKKCIYMEMDEEGFRYPVIDQNKCIHCNLCEETCPIVVKKETCDGFVRAYAAINENEQIRNNSSSGGIFTLLAEKVLADSGIVFGAMFDDQYDVVHSYVDNVKDLSKFRGSKYVQSRMGNSYIDAKKFLDQGKTVYFSGTPCQVEGLLSFLGGNYRNLITQDIVCHGVPSEKIWHIYNERYGKIEDFSFRDKTNGWNSYSYRVNQRLVSHFSDSYSKAFISGLDLRPSCYDCKFKNKNRISDITLADLWGANEVVPKLDDGKGTSLVVVNTLTGENLFDSVKCKKEIISLDAAIVHNDSYIQSTKMHKKRNDFFEEVSNENFDYLVKKYTKQSFFKKVLKKIKHVICKIIK